jgi:hypothetical protein
MNRLTAMFATAALFAPAALVLAAEPEATTEKPAAVAGERAPTKDDVPALIKQLGDDDPKTRDRASQQLRKVGKDALPALAEAAKDNPDPEVVSRAQSVTRQIDEDLHPKPKAQPQDPFAPNGARIRIGGNVGGGAVFGGGNGNVQIMITSSTVHANGKSVSITNRNGVVTKETTVTQGDDTIKIKEDADGIAVTTTQKKDDKETTETVKAKDAETLKKEHPKAFELFEKHGKDAQVKLEGFGGNNIRLDVGGANGVGAIDDKELKAVVERAQKQAEEARKQAEKALKDADEQSREARKKLEEKDEK